MPGSWRVRRSRRRPLDGELRPERPRDLRRALLAGAAHAALFAAVAAPSSGQAAEFLLFDGSRMEGAVVDFGGKFLAIETDAEVLIMRRDQVLAVTTYSPEGVRAEGALLDWNAGVYRVVTPEGAFSTRDASSPLVEETPTAAAAAPTAPPPADPDASGGPSPEALTALEERLGPGSESTGFQSPAIPDREADDLRVASRAPNLSGPEFDEADAQLAALAADVAQRDDTLPPPTVAAVGGLGPVNDDTDLNLDAARAPDTDVPVDAAVRVRTEPPEAGAASEPGDAELDNEALRAEIEAGGGPQEGDATPPLSASPSAPGRPVFTPPTAQGSQTDQVFGEGPPEPDSPAVATDAATDTPPDAPPGGPSDAAAASVVAGGGDPSGGGGRRVLGADSVNPTPAPPATDAPGFSRRYVFGVLGRDAWPEGDARPSVDYAACAAFATLTESPRAFAAERADPAALYLATPDDVAPRMAVALAAKFFEIAAANGALVRDEPLLRVLEAGEARLFRPARIAVASFETAGDADRALSAAGADIGFFTGARAQDDALLIGFDAIAVAMHPSSPIAALSKTDLNGVLSGVIDDWSMISPEQIGGVTLYLPPSGSESMRALLSFAGVRRARPGRALYIADPDARVRAAAQDPSALVVAPMSALGALSPTPIGGRGGGVAPTIDTVRSATYPLDLVRPIYARRADTALHPGADLFLEFLISPAGQRALYDAGLAPVAACDPSSCNITAPGIDQARAALGRLTGWSEPRIIEGVVDITGAAAAILLPDPSAPTSVGLVTALEGFLRETAGEGRSARIVVHSGGFGADADETRTERAIAGSIRAQGVALALRCAGVDVTEIIIDADTPPLPQGGPDLGLRHRVEILLR